MEKPLWEFIDNQGTFVSKNANQLTSLYFPLCNNSIMSSISPDLHGDIKTDFNSFLLEPVSRIDISNLKSSRNFWIYINPGKIWSATGVAKDLRTIKHDDFKLEAGLLWQKITRSNKKIGLKAQITSFCPATDEPVEIMRLDLTNISGCSLSFIPTAAIPIFARSASNLHDHRHVTSLLNRITTEKFGVIVKPTLSFDETGHKKNLTSYFVLGIDEKGSAPEYIYPTQEGFTGEGSDLEAPAAVFNNLLPDNNIQGKEAMGALRFKKQTLKPGQTRTYIILMGIAKDKVLIKHIFHKFNTPLKINRDLQNMQLFWQNQSSKVSVNSGDSCFDNWVRWVNIQPVLRKIFGCSFLPDFDYGKGGRGWRDLWQDCLSLILKNPREVRSLIINNFSGVRIDGSNATVIGKKQGEFIADRN
ncbi:MAG: cellobiose phosphorylase, partial [Candidatus Omnitrophica bacterium]|nr:cellobiose phosphorylase [Candidatus Omnitrophota bacterium]